jgi:O-antigen/teichoic acid export membrane protein
MLATPITAWPASRCSIEGDDEVTSVDTAGAPLRPEESAADLRQLARGSVLNLAGSVVAASLNLVLPIIITRSMTKEDAGLFFQATAVFAILLNIGTAGADTGVLRFLPRALALHRRLDLRRYLVLAIAPAVVFTVLLSGALILVSGWLSGLVTHDAASADSFQDSVIVIALWVPVGVTYAIVMSASRGLGSVRPLVFVEKIGRNSLETACAGIAAAASASVAVIVCAWVAPYAAMLVVVAVWVARRLHRVRNREGGPGEPPTDWRTLGSDFWRFSAPRALSRAFTIALQRFDILVVGALRGPADAAVYAVATRFLILGLMFVQAIQQVMSPKISECLTLGEYERAETIYRATTAWLTLVSWPIYLMAMLYAPLLLSIFGEGYDQGSVAVAILCAAMLVATACGPVDSMLLMGGRSMLSLINTGLALLVNVVLDLLIVPELGATGAALGWAVGIWLKNLLALWQVNGSYRMHPLGRGTQWAMVICALSFFVVPGAIRLLFGTDIVAFFVAGLLGTALFAVLVRARYDVLDLVALRAVVRRRQRR